jgi:choice-of-anchor A domain-containing protein
MRFVLLGLFPCVVLAATLEDFSVYAIRSIRLGDARVPQGSDIRGRLASAGEISLSNLSVSAPSGESDDRMIVAGTKIQLKHVVVEDGGFEAGGDVEIEDSTVNGDVWSGGSFRGERSAVKGLVRYSVSYRVQKFTTEGKRQRDFSQSFGYAALNRELRARSETYAKLKGAPLRNGGKGRYLCVEESANPIVCDVPAKMLELAKELVFQGREGRHFIVNVAGKEAKLSFKSTFLDEDGKALDPRETEGAVHWNFRSAKKISLRKVEMPGTLLAPEATVIGDEFSRVRGRAHVGAFEGQARVGF